MMEKIAGFLKFIVGVFIITLGVIAVFIHGVLGPFLPLLAIVVAALAMVINLVNLSSAWRAEHPSWIKSAAGYTAIVLAIAAALCYGWLKLLKGYRDVPWPEIYWRCVIVASTVVLLQLAMFNVAVKRAACNWAKRTAFGTAILSRDNLAANTFLILWLLFSIDTVLFGFPNQNSIDWELQRHKAADTAVALFNPTVNGARTTYTLPFSFGGTTADNQAVYQAELERYHLQPRYPKGWWRMQLWLPFTILAFVALISSRRDEAADVMSAMSNWLRERQKSKVHKAEEEREKKTEATKVGDAKSAPALAPAAPPKQLGPLDKVWDEVLGAYIVRILDSMARYLKKAVV